MNTHSQPRGVLHFIGASVRAWSLEGQELGQVGRELCRQPLAAVFQAALRPLAEHCLCIPIVCLRRITQPAAALDGLGRPSMRGCQHRRAELSQTVAPIRSGEFAIFTIAGERVIRWGAAVTSAAMSSQGSTAAGGWNPFAIAILPSCFVETLGSDPPSPLLY